MKVGDKVTWTHCSTRGRTLSMKLREGVIEELCGSKAIIRKSGDRRESVAIARLRSPGQRSQIAEFVEIIRETSPNEVA